MPEFYRAHCHRAGGDTMTRAQGLESNRRASAGARPQISQSTPWFRSRGRLLVTSDLHTPTQSCASLFGAADLLWEKPTGCAVCDGPSIACCRIMTQIVFPRWVTVVVAAIVVLGLTAFAVGLVGVYIADEYMTPGV